MEFVADILKFLLMIDDHNFLSSALGLIAHTVELTDLARLYYYILIETVSQSVSQSPFESQNRHARQKKIIEKGSQLL